MITHDQLPRSEHIAWCKERALSYLPNYRVQALMSMISDLGKHPETANHPAIEILTPLLIHQLPSVTECEKLISDFN